MPDIKIGCVADDFTGASDIASFFKQAGLETLLINELPGPDFYISEETDCIVIALKTRTMETKEAIRQSMEAFYWFNEIGAQKLYFKYCSTFDSTSEGNIGPVTDAVLETFHIPYTVLCPSLPVNGRTVKNGLLYVNEIPLHESHMKDHPLTPMRKSGIAELMKGQGKYQCKIIDKDLLYENQVSVAQMLSENEPPFYLIPDYYEEDHGLQIAKVFKECRFFTGGSGLGAALARIMGQQKTKTEIIEKHPVNTGGKGLILAGSCSAITLKQIADFIDKGYPSYRVDPKKLISGEETTEHIWNWIETQTKTPLIYSSATAKEIEDNHQYGRETVALAIEKLLSTLAATAVKAGRTRIIVAGGETSGAVTKALGYETFYISESLAPGVPVMIPLKEPVVRLVLKSGNFGQVDFFDRAVKMTKKEN